MNHILVFISMFPLCSNQKQLPMLPSWFCLPSLSPSQLPRKGDEYNLFSTGL